MKLKDLNAGDGFGFKEDMEKQSDIYYIVWCNGVQLLDCQNFTTLFTNDELNNKDVCFIGRIAIHHNAVFDL